MDIGPATFAAACKTLQSSYFGIRICFCMCDDMLAARIQRKHTGGIGLPLSEGEPLRLVIRTSTRIQEKSAESDGDSKGAPEDGAPREDFGAVVLENNQASATAASLIASKNKCSLVGVACLQTLMFVQS